MGRLRSFAKTVYTAAPLKRPLLTLLRRFYVPDESIYRHLYFDGIFTVGIDRDHSFKIYHHGYEAENTIFWEGLTGGWESLALSIWCELCASSEVIIDVGANTGIYALTAKAINPTARVIALEPIARVFDKLAHNVAINDFDIECIPAAASDVDGTATIFDFPGEHSYSSTFHTDIFSGSESVALEVQTCQIATIVSERGLDRVDLLKIDVEGHEPAVLSGMTAILEKSRPSILIEILTDDVGNEVSKLTSGLGYRTLYLDEAAKVVRPVTELKRRESYNYLLCQEATLDVLSQDIALK